MSEEREKSVAHHGSESKPPEVRCKTPLPHPSGVTRKKFPPDHPYHFAWDLTEEDKGKHLIFVGGIGPGSARRFQERAEREKVESEPPDTQEPKPPDDQNTPVVREPAHSNRRAAVVDRSTGDLAPQRKIRRWHQIHTRNTQPFEKATLRALKTRQAWEKYHEAQVRSLLPEMSEEQVRELAERLTQMVREWWSATPGEAEKGRTISKKPS